jgi:hypothetical protein
MSRTTALTNSPNPGEQADRLNQDGSAAEQIGVAPVKVSTGAADPSPPAQRRSLAPRRPSPSAGLRLSTVSKLGNALAEFRGYGFGRSRSADRTQA